MSDKYGSKCSTLPAPYEKITDWWQKQYIQQKRVKTQRTQEVKDTWAVHRNRREFHAMYCLACGTFNSEEGEFYGCCTECGEILRVG